MRLSIWAGLGTAMALAITPAHAEWHGYFNKQGVEFSFTAPSDLKGERSKYNSVMAGARDSVVFTTVEDNLQFKITVVDFTGRASDQTALIKEASAAYQDRTKVLLDEDARVESSYGRKLTVDMPENGGRVMAAIYFKDNHLVQLQATVLPGGDLQSANMGRFVDSLAFYENRAGEGAIELKLPD